MARAKRQPIVEINQGLAIDGTSGDLFEAAKLLMSNDFEFYWDGIGIIVPGGPGYDQWALTEQLKELFNPNAGVEVDISCADSMKEALSTFQAFYYAGEPNDMDAYFNSFDPGMKQRILTEMRISKHVAYESLTGLSQL
jgi:hypothetical protein